MRDRWINAALVLGGVAAALGISAVVLGIAGLDHADREAYEDIYRPSEDPLLQVELIPNVNEHVNADGFFGRDYAIEKPRGTFRVVGVGDSVAMYFSAERLNHSCLLEQTLPALSGTPVEVLNLAVAGYDTPQQVRSLEVRGLKYDPDLVMVSHCVNDSVDLALLVRDVAGLDPETHPPPTLGAQERIRDASGDGWEALFRDHIEPSERWRESLAAYTALAVLAAEHRFGVILVLFPTLVELDDYFLAPVHRAVAAHARALGFDVVDLLESFRREEIDGLRGNSDDVIHPSPEAYRVAAAAIRSALAESRPWARMEAP